MPTLGWSPPSSQLPLSEVRSRKIWEIRETADGNRSEDRKFLRNSCGLFQRKLSPSINYQKVKVTALQAEDNIPGNGRGSAPPLQADGEEV